MRFLKKIYFLIVILSLLSTVPGIAGQSGDDRQTKETTLQGKEILLAANGFFHIPEDVLDSLTPGERRWYNRFQEGIPFFDGWKKITRAVVEKFPEYEREKILAAMQSLGIKIGYEWSRDNRVRKVNTEMLRAWGRDLRKAGTENHVQLAKVLYKIDNEINILIRLE